MDGNEDLIDYEGKNTRYTFFTFRAAPNEPQVFEDYLTLILPIIHKSSQYSYSIEMDDSPNRHIHVFCSLGPKEKDASKIKQRFCEFKDMKLFRKSLNFKSTNWNVAFRFGKKYNEDDSESLALIPRTESDHMKALGYTMKAIDKRYKINGIKITEMTRAMKFYATTARIKDSSLKNNWTAIKPQNIHTFLEDFCKKNNVDVNDTGLIPMMVKSKHTFNQITSKQLKLSIAELKYQQTENDEENFENLMVIQNHVNDVNPTIDELMEENIKLQEKLKNFESEKINQLNNMIETMRDTHKFQIQQRDKEIKRLKDKLNKV